MWKNYLKIAFRNLKRNRGYAVINIGGLAVGMAACLLITLFVRDELSYDDFHKHSDRIYRVAYSPEGDKWSKGRLHQAAPLAPALERSFPGVAEAVRVSTRWGHDVLVKRGENTFYEDQFLLADSAFLEVFSFPLVRGNPGTALSKPYSVVITEETARKYFGDQDPMGKTIQARGFGEMHELTVTGVAKDLPPNTHLQFDLLASFNTLPSTVPDPKDLNSWNHVLHYTYVLLKEGHPPEDVQQGLPALAERYEGASPDYALQPITGIHLRSHFERELAPNSDLRYVYIFSVLALLVLGVACINYMNLATARSAHRAKEVGVRKVIGARRGQIVRQFLGESALLCAAALVLAYALALVSLPLFNQLTGKELALGTHGGLLVGFLAVGAIVTLVAGSYPALVLSGIQPVPVLRGLFRSGKSGAGFRKGLVVFQFVVSVALIAATIIIGRQLRHMQTKKLGLSEEHVVVVHARDALEGRQKGQGKYYTFKQQLLQQAGVTGVTATSSALPASEAALSLWLIPEGVSREQWRKRDVTLNHLTVDPDFTEVMDIPVLEGRNLSADFRSEEHIPVLINETAAQALGWEKPVGKTFTCCVRPTPRVVGVVQDFHYEPLRQRIEPLVLMERWANKDAYYAPSRVLVRMQPGNPQRTLDFLREKWAEVSDVPFEYTFLDQRFDEAYRTEARTAKVFGVFAVLAVLLACLGLFGLAAFMAEQRTKEIGIRKVLGASAANIVALLSKDFVRLVVVAALVAAPLAWYAMQRWLQDFAYRIELGPWVFVGAGVLALAIALATVSYHALRSALTNPADALRYE